MSDYKDIWQDSEHEGTLSDEQLLAYIEGRLPEEERRAVEELLSREGMESDAIEGLQALDADEARGMKKRLDISLQKVLSKKRKARRGIGEQRWTWIAIGIVLILAIVCYAVMYLLKGPGR
jgi:anti-sigma factor RsiW